ncbi:MAG: hypothetical protein ACJ8EL_04640 [Rhizomicrobium sp.]|jgi:hypothetical protein
MAIEERVTVTLHRRARHDPRDHKLLIVFAVLAVAYCLCAPLLGNLIGRFF